MKIRKIFRKLLWFQLVLLPVGMFVYYAFTYAEEAEEPHWMPDPALRQAVREKLGIPVDEPLTQTYVQLRLTNLDAREKGIVDLTGLEHATDLQFLILIRNEIHDLSPLSGITGLVFIDLAGNQISDLSPLAGLVNLEVLKLPGNQIVDVSPLAGLVNLTHLSLSFNQIADISPLSGLENLENLDIRHNEKRVLWTLPLSKLKQFGYDETCDLEHIPVSERIEDREYPSIFGAFGGGIISNLPELTWEEAWAHYDLVWSSLLFSSTQWIPSPEGVKPLVHVETAKRERDYILSRNPNMIFLVAMNYQAANPDEYPEDWPYWLRDESGNKLELEHGPILIDFTYPEVQDYLVRQVIELAKCGLFDGIFFDWWRDDWQDSDSEWEHYYAHDVSDAAITMLRRIREGVDEVRDDFLIIANGNRTKLPRSAPYINGSFMETIEPYSYNDLKEIESTLLWSELNFREPQINCLEGWADKREPVDGPRNQQWMRLFTTMSLTHSDGYVNFVRGLLPNHTHLYEIQEGHSEVHARGELHSHPGDYWFPFYDAPLGRPVGGDPTKGQFYVNSAGEAIDGLFIREFTQGWAVYNRSGNSQEISLPIQTTGVASGITSFKHTVPDLDGEMFLKTEVTADVNGDGVVNILDLVAVANAFGEAEPDLNGDGIVNILDLVIVANAFGD